MDLCLIWGSNVLSRTYRNPDLSFEQAGNVCYSRWTGQVRLNQDELSNNHIIPMDADLEHAFEQLGEGDQVRLEGSLVNVHLQPIRGGFDTATHVEKKTSTSRSDRHLGSCEIILADKLEVLAPGTPSFRLVNRISFWLLVLFLFVAVLLMLRKNLPDRR